MTELAKIFFASLIIPLMLNACSNKREEIDSISTFTPSAIMKE